MKKQDGITLIALIITIIVMLILVAVTVAITVNSGLFGHAQEATQGYEDAQTNEMDIDNKVTGGPDNSVQGINNLVDYYTSST